MRTFTHAESTRGSLNGNGPPQAHLFDCLLTRKWCYLRGIRKCVLVGVDVALLKGVVGERGLGSQ